MKEQTILHDRGYYPLLLRIAADNARFIDQFYFLMNNPEWIETTFERNVIAAMKITAQQIGAAGNAYMAVTQSNEHSNGHTSD